MVAVRFCGRAKPPHERRVAAAGAYAEQSAARNTWGPGTRRRYRGTPARSPACAPGQVRPHLTDRRVQSSEDRSIRHSSPLIQPRTADVKSKCALRAVHLQLEFILEIL